jgi:LysM repeat protein
MLRMAYGVLIVTQYAIRHTFIPGLLALLLAACGGPAPSPSPQTLTPSTPSSTPQIGVSLVTLAPPTAVILQTTPTPLPTPTLTPTPTPIIYVIEAGDTLLGIAIAQGTTTEEILALNPDVRPEALQIGQGLVLPQPTAVSLAAVGTPLPLDVEVTQIHAYQTAVGSVWLIGEVTNKGEAPVENVQVEIGLLDERGEAVTAALAWTAVPIIQPGASSPFGALLNEPPPFVQPSAAVVGGQAVAELGNRHLDLAALDTAVTQLNARVEAAGRIQNVGEQTAVDVTVAAAFYNEQGEIVGFGLMALPDPLAPGEARPFTVSNAPPGGTAVSATVSPFARLESGPADD